MAPISPFESSMAESTPAPILLLLHVFNLAMAFICSISTDNKDTQKKLMLSGSRYNSVSDISLYSMTMEEKQHELRTAVKAGDLETVQNLLRTETYHSAADKEGYTPLHWAAAKGHLDIAHVLLDSGALLEERAGKKFLFTPLHMASGEGHLELCRLLLDRGANVAATDRYRDTALHWAAWFGHLPVVQLLVQRGANVNAKNTDGHTAQDMATLRRHHKVIDWLQQQ